MILYSEPPWITVDHYGNASLNAIRIIVAFCNPLHTMLPVAKHHIIHKCGFVKKRRYCTPKLQCCLGHVFPRFYFYFLNTTVRLSSNIANLCHNLLFFFGGVLANDVILGCPICSIPGPADKVVTENCIWHSCGNNTVTGSVFS